MRACSANRDAARLCGIDAGNMVTLSFMVSAAIAPWRLHHLPYHLRPVRQRDAAGHQGFTVAILAGSETAPPPSAPA